jgi:hypothetical protein
LGTLVLVFVGAGLLTPVVASADVPPTETLVLEDEASFDIELEVEVLLEAEGLVGLPAVAAASSKTA